MKKDFNRIAITIDTDKQTRFRSEVRLKQRSINSLYAVLSKYVDIEDKSTLQGNFYNDFIELFLAKYQSQFPPISVNKMLEAMEVDTTKLEELTTQISAIDINLDKDLNAQEPDFNIYTESEDQNKLYKTLERIAKDLAKLYTDHNIRLMPQNIQSGTSQALLYDWANKTMKPNIRKVLGTERM
jgi:hypothetical protein